MTLSPPTDSDTWIGLDNQTLPVNEALEWVNQPECGAVVLFTGNIRNHAEGRANVTEVTYESYEEQALSRLEKIAEKTREHWPEVRRIVMLHQIGKLEIGETAVIVLASSAHRDDSFSAGRWCIDTLKKTVPIWKSEIWEGGSDWGLDAQHIIELDELNSFEPDNGNS